MIGTIFRKIRKALAGSNESFPGSAEYWKERYASGGSSGAGSYNRLAEFKAEVINGFVERNTIQSVIEYGCGDGNQLELGNYSNYLGFDVSPTAIDICRKKFAPDKTKSFRLVDDYQGETAQLCLSLDVIYHLIEDDVYHEYMMRLFKSSERFVIIYSSDYEKEQQYHERRRKFSDWTDEYASSWNLIQHIPNKYPWNGVNEESSLASFYIYEMSQA